MSEDLITKAYNQMQEAYDKWANAERPITHLSLLSIMEDETIFTRFGRFREKEWDSYCLARDTYLEIVKMGATLQ